MINYSIYLKVEGITKKNKLKTLGQLIALSLMKIKVLSINYKWFCLDLNYILQGSSPPPKKTKKTKYRISKDPNYFKD